MKKIMAVVGFAPCVKDDLKALHEFIPSHDLDYTAVGLDVVDQHSLPFSYMATYHVEDIDLAKQKRIKTIGQVDFKVICHVKDNPNTEIFEPYKPPSGSSALLAAQACLRMGYRKIVLCGCPLLGSNQKAQGYEKFHRGWIAEKDLISPFVRSMSGWTNELLGMPTREWLDE